MNRICKIIGAVAVVGAAVIAGTIFLPQRLWKGIQQSTS